MTNAGAVALDWSAMTNATWLTLSPTAGTLAAGAQAQLDVRIDSVVAATLASGTYDETVTVRDLTGGLVSAVIPVGLDVTPLGGAFWFTTIELVVGFARFVPVTSNGAAVAPPWKGSSFQVPERR